MKTILYATDYSGNSIASLKNAYNISQRLSAGFVVLHVFDIPLYVGASIFRPEQQIEKYAFEEHLDILKRFCKKHLGNELDKMDVRPMVIKNVSIVEGILMKSKELLPDMIMVGMQESQSQRGLFGGDIGKALIEKAPCPVLVLPKHSNAIKIENIMYATDFEEDDIYAIEKLVTVAKPFNAKITVIHISPKDEYAGEAQMQWFMEMLQLKVSYENIETKVIFSDHIYEELMTALNSVKADVLAMLERKSHGFFRKIFHRDLVKRMESHIEIPLLSYNKSNLL